MMVLQLHLRLEVIVVVDSSVVCRDVKRWWLQHAYVVRIRVASGLSLRTLLKFLYVNNSRSSQD